MFLWLALVDCKASVFQRDRLEGGRDSFPQSLKRPQVTMASLRPGGFGGAGVMAGVMERAGGRLEPGFRIPSSCPVRSSRCFTKCVSPSM